MDELKKAIRSIPDFPKEGIVFRDITTLIGDGSLSVVAAMAARALSTL